MEALGVASLSNPSELPLDGPVPMARFLKTDPSFPNELKIDDR